MGATTTMTQHETEKHSMVEQLRLMKLKKEGLLKGRSREEEFNKKYGDHGAGDETRRMYLEVMKIFEGRNFKKERVELRKEADNLVSTAKVSQFARKGHYMLEKARGNVDSDQPLMDKLLFDPTRVQMKYMNGYLNHYTEKLARANADEPSDI